MKTKKLTSRGAKRAINKVKRRVPARNQRKSNARSTSTRAGVSRLKKGKKKSHGKKKRPVVKAGTRVSKKLPLKRRVRNVVSDRLRRKSGRKAIRRVVKPSRDKLGRFKSHRVVRKKTSARRKAGISAARSKKRSSRVYALKNETKIITCSGKGREVVLYGEFELFKRTMSFKQAPPRVDKLPYQKQISTQARQFYKDHGQGTYLFKTRISLQTDDGELVDRWFTPFARKQHDSADSFGKELADLNLTMQELAKGYLRDSYENYRLEDIEFEYIDASKLVPSEEAS